MEILMHRIRGMETTEGREEGRMEDTLQILDGGQVLAAGMQEMEVRMVQVAEVPLEAEVQADEERHREVGTQAVQVEETQAEAGVQAVGIRLEPDVEIQLAAAEIQDVTAVLMQNTAERNAELNFLSVCC